MSAAPTSTYAQRSIHARRTRFRRGRPASASTRGSRSSSGGEGKSEESEVTAGLTGNNRFAVLRSIEPAPDTTDQPSTSEKIKETSLPPTSSLVSGSKRPSTLRLARHATGNSAPLESDQQPSAVAAASVSLIKHQAQPSPLVLRIDYEAATDNVPSLPSPPIPPDPMTTPCLATLPVPPSFDLKYLTSLQSCEPISSQFATPKPTGLDIFRSNDSMHHIVSSTRGKIFWMAAEIAAANEKSMTRPVGNVLVPGPARRPGELKGKVNRNKLDRKRGDYVESREDTECESDDEEGGGEGWLGKDDGFWKQPFEDRIGGRLGNGKAERE